MKNEMEALRLMTAAFRRREYKPRAGSIVDEAHQAAGESTAIAVAMSELIAVTPLHILTTGTLLNGYAQSVFHLLFRVAPATLRKAGYEYSDVTAFTEAYGRIERTTVTTEKAGGNDNRQSRGGASRTRLKVLPGIMPDLFGHHHRRRTSR